MRSQPWKNETTRARLPDSPVQSSPGEEHMDIIAQLKAERDKAAQQVSALDTAIGALSGLNSTRAPRGRRTMSAAARARIAAAQRARWAKVKGQRKVVAIAPKRKISAAGLARIRPAKKERGGKGGGGEKKQDLGRLVLGFIVLILQGQTRLCGVWQRPI